jgi:hypothetical protein
VRPATRRGYDWRNFVLPMTSESAKYIEITELPGRSPGSRPRDHGQTIRRYQDRSGPVDHVGGSTGVPAQFVGGLWGRLDFDLDVAGVDLDGSGFFGECKWTAQPVDMRSSASCGDVQRRFDTAARVRGVTFSCSEDRTSPWRQAAIPLSMSWA